MPEQGSCFSIIVPRSASEPDKKPFPVPDPVHEQAAKQTKKLHVLAVDNEPEILAGTEALLHHWDMDVDTASGSADAFAHLRASPVDIILMDYHLGEQEDGLRLLDSIYAEFGVIPAILVTANRSEELIREARQRNVRILHKPIKPAKLRALLGRLGNRE